MIINYKKKSCLNVLIEVIFSVKSQHVNITNYTLHFYKENNKAYFNCAVL